MRRNASPSLLRPLLLRLMAPLLVIVAATGALGVTSAQWLTDRTFDQWLLDAAQALARQVQFEAGQAQLELGVDDQAIVAYDVIDRGIAISARPAAECRADRRCGGLTAPH